MLEPHFDVKVDQIDPNKVAERFSTPFQKHLLKCGIIVEKEMKLLLSVGGYSVSESGEKTYEPSNPGDPPHLRTGTLRASVQTAWDPATKSVVVGSTRTAWYGKIHEHGGRFHPKRPFAMPALLRARPKFKNLKRTDK